VDIYRAAQEATVQQARADAATRVLSRRVPFCDAADDSLARLDTPPYQRTAHVRPKVDNEREREKPETG
jgi:hypothetical protein